MPITSQEQYDKAKTLVSSGQAKDPVRLQKSMRRWESFAMPQVAGTVGVEGVGPGSKLEQLQGEAMAQQTEEDEKARLQGQANKQGYNIDLSQPDVVTNLANDPQRTQVIEKVKAATRDDSLPNQSKLKVFNDPPDYVPPQAKFSLANPFSFLPTALQRQYFYEPPVSEFRAAMTDGSIARRLKKEFNLVDDVSKLSDQDIENSTTFKAFQDASWKHALADAMKQGYAISRVSQTKDMGNFDKAQAKALDPVVAGAFGLAAGATNGISRIDETDAERSSSNRNPNVALGGEIIGSLAPGGLPARITSHAAGLLGKAGLGSKGVQGVVKGIGAGAMAGAVDANIREIAKFTAEALDAGDSAEEAAHKLYEMAKGIPATTAKGAALGGGLAAGGELLGGLARAGARGIVGGKPREMLLHSDAAGLKMNGLGGPDVPKDLVRVADEAAFAGKVPEKVLADQVADRLASQRLLEQEGMHRAALQDTAKAREALQVPGSAGAIDVTVPTAGAADKIDELRRGMSDITGDVNRNQLRSIAQRLRQRGKVTAQQLDADIDALELKAKSGVKEPDPNILAVKKILLDLRDEFKFPDEATKVDNFAIRDPQGNVKPVDGYSAVKARQAREKTSYEVENAAMGLPKTLKGEALNIGQPPSELDAAALGESVLPKVKFLPNEREAFVERIATSGNPENAVRHEQYRDLAARAGLGDGEVLKKIRQLRSTREWRQYLGQAVSGIGTGGGAFLKSSQLLRAVPTLNSLSGGLPKMEATDKVSDIIDRFLENSVPSWRGLHLRGGQAARPAGTLASGGDAKTRDSLTPEEAQFAAAVIKNLKDLEK